MESIKVDGIHIGNVTKYQNGYKAYPIDGATQIWPKKWQAVDYLKARNKDIRGA